jgi:hypothetical protein
MVVRTLMSASLCAGVMINVAVPAYAVEWKETCETIVEVGTSIGGFVIARKAGRGEIGRTVGAAVGDKVGGRIVAPHVCGDERGSVATQQRSVAPPTRTIVQPKEQSEPQADSKQRQKEPYTFNSLKDLDAQLQKLSGFPR